jgi:hypothetical protein
MAHAPSGGLDEVEDVVQDAWFRLGRADRWEIGRVAVRPVVPIPPLAPETPETPAAPVTTISAINAWNRISVTTRMVHESFRNQNG